MRGTTAAALVTAVAVVGLGGCFPSGPTADYRFQDSFGSSVGSARELVLLGPGIDTFVTDVVDGTSRRVWRFPSSNGLALSTDQATTTPYAWSMAVLFRFDTTSGYRRVFDLSAGLSETGLYVLDGRLSFYPRATGTAAPISPGAWVQVVLTRDSGGSMAGYVNGVQHLRFTDTANEGVISQGQLRWFWDNTVGCCTNESSAGAAARIRLWKRALSASEVAGLGRLP
jgi:hypothetical protein